MSRLADDGVLPESVLQEAGETVVHKATADQTLIERLIGRAMAFLGGALVVAELIILGWGVTTRYLLDSPSTWSDEVAVILFIWLSMVGAVLAAQRSEHMRMTAAIQMLPPACRPWINAFAEFVATAFLATISVYAIEYAIHQGIMTTPALQMSDTWRASALPMGLLLMLVISVIRLRLIRPAHLIGAIAVTAIIASLFWTFRATWLAMGPMSLSIFFGPLAILIIFCGTQIAFSFGTATLAYLFFCTPAPLTVELNRMDTGMSNLLLLAVPLFIFLGLLIEVTGMARAMVGFLASLLGHVRGGLEYVLLGAMFLVSGISGSKIADMAAVAPILLPEMKKRGNDPPEMVALLAGAGAMSETIPPSIVLITIGAVAGVSISALFAGGMVPAALAAVALMVVVGWRAIKKGSAAPRASGHEIWRAFLLAAPGLVLPMLIRVFVLGGITTATEVSTIGVAYALVVALFTWREVEWRRIFPILADTAAMSGVILLLVGCATAMAWALTQSGFSRGMTQVMASGGGVPTFWALSIVVFVVLGSVLEGMPVIVLFGPLIFPVARALGINDVHYAMVLILAMGIGLFAPPFGLGFYAACAIGRVSPDETMRHIWPFLGVLMIALAVIALFPSISTCML
jgi:tripartite ATP-independent transporter DctM subunit